MSCSLAPYGASRSANTAATTMAARTSAAIQKTGPVRLQHHAQLRSHARIEQRVRDVDQQADDHEDQRDDQHHALHHREVAVEDRLHDQAPHARPREDRLGHHRAAQELRELEPEQRHDRDRGVAERVQREHAPLAEPLGARGAHVVLPEHLQHARAHEPREPARARSWRGSPPAARGARACRSRTPGSQRSCTPKNAMSSSASQKIGIAWPATAPTIASRSIDGAALHRGDDARRDRGDGREHAARPA